MKKLLRLVMIVIAHALVTSSYSQEIKVKSFSLQMEPMTVPMQRKDNNGEFCALVKVIIPTAQASFEGSLIGNCEFKTSEYWCYLTPGSKHLKIKYPNSQPLLVDFVSLIGSGLKGSMIYELLIELPIANHSDLTFPMKGEIKRIESPNEEGLYYGDKIPYTPGYTIYKNYNNGKYDGKWNIDHVDYSISGIQIGDKLTVIPNDERYDIETKTVQNDDIGVDFNFHLFKKRVPLFGKLVDSENGEPLVDAEVSAGNRFKNIEWYKTDVNGSFFIDDLIIDEVYSLNCRDVPYGYPTDKPTTIIPMKYMVNGCVWEIEREQVRITVDLNGLHLSDIEATCQDGHRASVEPYPLGDRKCYIKHPLHAEKTQLKLKVKGFKTIIIDFDPNVKYVNTPIKFKKGDENEIIHYRTIHKSNGKNILEQVK